MSRKIKCELEITLRDKPSYRNSHEEQYARSFLSMEEDLDIVYNFLELTKLHDQICSVINSVDVLSVNNEPVQELLKRIRKNENE